MSKSNFCEDCKKAYLEKNWLNKNRNGGKGSVLKFSIPHGLMSKKRT